MLCLQQGQMHSQMGADWAPDDLWWCGVVSFGAKRQGIEGERREQGHWEPDVLLKFTQSWWDAMMRWPARLSSIRKGKRKTVSQTRLFLCCTVVLANNCLFYHSRTKEN